MIENIQQEIKRVVGASLEKAISQGELPTLEIPEVVVEIPREKENGDFSTNIAMQLTKTARKAPRQIADSIIKNLDLTGSNIEKVECAGPGFINFYLKLDWLYEALRVVQREKENYGRINLGNGKKVMVEFVSANPTGPLHMGNARGGALGDCIASVLDAAGYDVTREFYLNDAGNQIEKFGISLEARYIQQLKGEDAIAFPEDGYHGEDITDHMKEYISLHGDKLLSADQEERRRELIQFALKRNVETIKTVLETYGVKYDVWFSEKSLHGDKLLSADQEERRRELIQFALKRNVETIKTVLETYGVKYDVWFSEKSLHESGKVTDTVNYLKEKGCTVEKEDALWFKAADFGAEKDEVLVRNNGIPTYFAADIAYHRNKFLERGFDWVINLLGADHHGHVARMKGAVSALGINPDRLDVVLFQLVRLYRNGEIARMSKRTGKAISLSDLLEEVGVDAARYTFNTKASGSHLDFDLDLVVKQTNENPVFYVQYAHARICSMLKLLEGEGIGVPQAEGMDLTLLKQKEEVELMKKLAEYPEEIRIAAQTLEPSRLTRYVQDVAGLFHSFYNACRVKGEEEGIMKARLLLVDSTRIVIRNVLKLMKISAPERM